MVKFSNSQILKFLDERSNYLFPIAVFSLALYLQYTVAFFGLDLHHDLFMFDAARNFYSGQIPYKDFFYQYNLGTVFLHGATLGLFGLKIISLKKITAVFYALIALLIYKCCALEGCRRSGFVVSIMWALLSPFYMPALNGFHAWPTVYMMFSCMAGLFYLLLANRNNSIFYAFNSGVFFGLSFWFKQIAAIQILFVITWFLVNIAITYRKYHETVKFLKIFSGFALGGVAVSIPFFVYLFAKEAIFDWWKNAFEFNAYFSQDSQPISGVGAFLKLLFPIAGDLGYLSYFWAICPLLLCVITYLFFFGSKDYFKIPISIKENISLLLIISLVGWYEYFPLPHSFHTQLFMAPAFVVVGVLFQNFSLTFDFLFRRSLASLMLVIFLLSGSYEAFQHLRGFYYKRQQHKQSVTANLGSTFDGLKLNVNEWLSLEKFYLNMLHDGTSKTFDGFIPLSVDPLRGLLPGLVAIPSEFKMGVNWTWPNELVEPGFSNKLNTDIIHRKKAVYADSLIYIPGYVPVALLEMASPITATHTLYKPAPIKSQLIYKEMDKSGILFAERGDFEFRSKNILFPWSTSAIHRILFPLGKLSEFATENIKNIHISMISEQEFPKNLSSLQLEYLNSNDEYYGGKLARLFEPAAKGRGDIIKNLNKEDKKNIAYFLLSQGKLFQSQNRPFYSSTFSYLDTDRPALVAVGPYESKFKYIWSAQGPGKDMNASFQKKGDDLIYLSLKEMTAKGIDVFLVMQLEFKDGGVRDYYYYYRNLRE